MMHFAPPSRKKLQHESKLSHNQAPKQHKTTGNQTSRVLRFVGLIMLIWTHFSLALNLVAGFPSKSIQIIISQVVKGRWGGMLIWFKNRMSSGISFGKEHRDRPIFWKKQPGENEKQVIAHPETIMPVKKSGLSKAWKQIFSIHV